MLLFSKKILTLNIPCILDKVENKTCIPPVTVERLGAVCHEKGHVWRA